MAAQRYIVITGGQMRNKGAQALLVTAVRALRARFPRHQIAVVSPIDAKMMGEARENLTYLLLDALPRPAIPLIKALARGAVKGGLVGALERERQARQVFARMDCLVDISGYALGESFGKAKMDEYLRRIWLAERQGAPVYLMPQSFGPFDHFEKWGLGAGYLRRFTRLMRYPSAIYCREAEGMAALSPYTAQNLKPSLDLVLLSGGEYNLSDVYRDPRSAPKVRVPEAPPGCAAIVPNIRVLEKAPQALCLYRQAVRTLRGLGRPVRLFAHAAEDIPLLHEIAAPFSGDPEVAVWPEAFDVFCLAALFAQFDLMLASRYHALVHACLYRVPFVALGWADKYDALSGGMGQADMCLSAETASGEDVDAALVRLCAALPERKSQIHRAMEALQAPSPLMAVSIKQHKEEP